MQTVRIKRPDLTGYQRDILDSPARFTITEASTKSGKTHSHLWWGIEQWHRKDVSQTWEVWWVAPVYQQAKIAFMRLRATFGKVPGYTFNDSDLSAKCPYGRIFRFKSGEKPDNLYGENVLAFIYDEFTRGRPETWPALRSTVTFTGGKGKMIGNFIGNANWGHQLMEAHRGDKDFAYFKITALQAVEAGILPAEEVEQARRSLPRGVFMALYMAEGSAHPLQMIAADAINDLWTNEHVAGMGKRYLTADIARFGRDKTVIGVWHGMRLVSIVSIPQHDMTEAAQVIRTMATSHKVPMSSVVIDEGGVGGGVVDMLKGCVSFNGAAAQIKVGKDVNYGNLRAQCYYRLADMVNDREIHIATEDNRDQIALELEVVRRMDDMAEGKLRVIKKDEMKELIGCSPDYGDMLMMRMYPELKPSTTTFEKSMAAKSDRFRREEFKAALVREFGHMAPIDPDEV